MPFKKKFDSPAFKAADSSFHDLRDVICEKFDTGRYFRILVVDESEFDRKRIKKALRAERTQIEEEYLVRPAVEKVSERRFDLVIIDYKLLLASGDDLFDKLVERKSVKIIFVGMLKQDAVAKELDRLGVYYIPKWDVKNIVIEVEKMVRVHFQVKECEKRDFLDDNLIRPLGALDSTDFYNKGLENGFTY